MDLGAWDGILGAEGRLAAGAFADAALAVAAGAIAFAAFGAVAVVIAIAAFGAGVVVAPERRVSAADVAIVVVAEPVTLAGGSVAAAFAFALARAVTVLPAAGARHALAANVAPLARILAASLEVAFVGAEASVAEVLALAIATAGIAVERSLGTALALPCVFLAELVLATAGFFSPELTAVGRAGAVAFAFVDAVAVVAPRFAGPAGAVVAEVGCVPAAAEHVDLARGVFCFDRRTGASAAVARADTLTAVPPRTTAVFVAIATARIALACAGVADRVGTAGGRAALLPRAAVIVATEVLPRTERDEQSHGDASGFRAAGHVYTSLSPRTQQGPCHVWEAKNGR